VRGIELEGFLVARDRLLRLVEDLLEQETKLQQEIELRAGIGR
jgi:hypothetical protein